MAYNNLTDSEQKHINELATEAESKRSGAGRPSVDNESILNELLAKPESRKKLKEQFKYLADQKRGVNAKNDAFKDDVKATKEVFGLSSGFISKTIDALVKDDVNKKMNEASQLSDLLSIFREEGDEDGEDFDDED